MTIIAHVDQYGADPTGVQPSDQAFAAAFATGAKVIRLGAGRYRLDQLLDLPHGMRIEGEGGRPMSAKGPTGAPKREAITTIALGANATIKIGQDARHSELRSLAVQGPRYADRDALISCTAPFHLADMYIRDSGRHGVRVYAQAGVGNANSWTMDDVWIENCGELSPGEYRGDGACVFIDGADGQGNGDNVHCLSSWGGIWDSSFLGCAWDSCSVEACGGVGYLSESARSIWLGCYCELDSPRRMGSCIIVGGTLAAATRSLNTVPTGKLPPRVEDASAASRHVVENRIGSPSRGLKLYVGGSAVDGKSILGWQADGDAHEVGWQTDGATTTLAYLFTRGRTALNTIMGVTRPGHSLGADQVLMPNGVHVGKGAARRHVTGEWLASVEARIKALEDA